MGLRQCDKCSEMVDEAKAFCPGCGHAFVEEEKRQEASKFEKVERTVQFGQTMYNQMLEDMGLNISGAPNPVERRVEVIAPVNTEVLPTAKGTTNATLQPSAKTTEKKTAVASKTESEPKAGNTKWYILIGAAVIFLLPVALASAILFVRDILLRLK